MDERGLTVSAWATISVATAALLPNQRDLDLSERSLRLHQVGHEILSGRRCDPRACCDEVGVGAEQFFALVGELGMTGALGDELLVRGVHERAGGRWPWGWRRRRGENRGMRGT